MLIKKGSAKRKNNSKNCSVFEYDFNSENLSLAIAEINGKYPDNGKSVNQECEQIYYVIYGSGVIHSNEGEVSIKEGDLYYFQKGKEYSVEGKEYSVEGKEYSVEGKELKVIVVNSPKWGLKQYRIVS